MKFGLDEATIDQLSKVFEANSKVDKALIFGSRAKGNYRNDSDIDIAIKGYNITLKDILQLSGSLEDAGVAQKVDLVAYDSIKEPALVEHIERVGVEFYSRWKEWKFSDFVAINPTVSLKGNAIYSFVEMKDLHDGNRFCFPSAKRQTSSGARFQEGDTLFARITPCLENGKICQVKGLEHGLGFGSTEFLVFRGKRNVSDNDFVFYLSRWNEVREFAESHFEGTSGRQRVSKDCFENLVLELPGLQEQLSVASTLGTLDDKIDLLHRQNRTLEALAETFFKQWFVEDEVTEWEEKELADYIFFDPKEKADRTKEYRFFDMKCLSNNSLLIAEGARRNVSSATTFRNNDTLLAKITPCLENGKTGFVMLLEDQEIARGSTEFVVMRSKGMVSPYWIYCLARDDDFREKAIQSMTGTSGRQRVQIDLLKSIKVKMNEGRMKDFHEMVTPYFQKIKSNTDQIISLAALRDSLLPKLMSGEIKLKLS